MLLYKDKFTGDEMFSDAFPIKLVDDVLYEVDCQMITLREGDIDIGANPSAEEAGEALDDGAITVNNVVHSFRLQSTIAYEKKPYINYLKSYVKRLQTQLTEELTNARRKELKKGDEEELTEEELKSVNAEIASFQKRAKQGFLKVTGGDFSRWEFYTGESMGEGGMTALLDYREDGTTPYFVFWKDGLKEEKL